MHRRTTNHQSSVTNSVNTPCEVPWYYRAYHERQAGAARGSNQEGGQGGGRRETIRCPPLPQCDHRDCVRTRESYSEKSAARFKVSLTLQNETLVECVPINIPPSCVDYAHTVYDICSIAEKYSQFLKIKLKMTKENIMSNIWHLQKKKPSNDSV